MSNASKNLLRFLIGAIVIVMVVTAAMTMVERPLLREQAPAVMNRTNDGEADFKSGVGIRIPKAMQEAMDAGKAPPPLNDVLPPSDRNTQSGPDPTSPAPKVLDQADDACPIGSADMPLTAGSFSEKELENMLAIPNIPEQMRRMIEQKLRTLRGNGK